LKGLGPKSRVMLAGIGITSAEQLRSRDPFEVYAELKASHAGVSLNMLYGLIGAVENRPWREVARDDRTMILLRLDDMGLL
jgi:DNA transformation protein